MDAKILDLDGIPEPIARALEVVAEMARTLSVQQPSPVDKAPDLPKWQLGIKGSLTREEIYGDYDYRF
jgi:hypothetical protein